MIKLMRRLLSALWGMLAGAIFKRLWKLAARKDEALKATDADRECGRTRLPPPLTVRRSVSSSS
jgi:hypothetical protein